MKQICVTVMNSEGGSQDSKAVKENILNQITKALQMVKLEKDPHAAFALIIDGKTLTYALEDEMKYQFEVQALMKRTMAEQEESILQSEGVSHITCNSYNFKIHQLILSLPKQSQSKLWQG